jgi:hypothetical protein
MKTIGILLGSALTIGTISNQALACSPQPPIFAQTDLLRSALNSPAYMEEVRKQFEQKTFTQITGVGFDRGVKVSLSNNCVIKVVHVYGEPQSGGMCPPLERIDATTECKDQE